MPSIVARRVTISPSGKAAATTPTNGGGKNKINDANDTAYNVRDTNIPAAGTIIHAALGDNGTYFVSIADGNGGSTLKTYPSWAASDEIKALAGSEPSVSEVVTNINPQSTNT